MENEESVKKSRELERTVLEKVGHVITSINAARHVDQVIVAVHSLAVCLFPIDSHSISGSIDEKCRNELITTEVPSASERTECSNVFYRGSAFRTFAQVLLYDVASNWLACFPVSVRRHLYDVFFVNGRVTEVVQSVVPCLQESGSVSYDTNAVCSNAERLLVLFLLENNGVIKMIREYGVCQSENLSHEELKQDISKVAQLVTSIPDKARRRAPSSLSPHLFFKRITIQLIGGAEERDTNLSRETAFATDIHKDGAFLFIGETLARIARRGSADVLLSEVIPCILAHVRNLLSSTADVAIGKVLESKPNCCFWLRIMEALKDPYSVERIAEQLLHQLAARNVSDTEGYWILWMLFHRICQAQTLVRSIFVEKFLFWKVFPVCCLRWILHFAVLGCGPETTSPLNSCNAQSLQDAVMRLVATWSKREFIQSASIEQQAYITAALGLCLEKMAKADLDATKDALQSILQGISCRLENPDYLVRKMASSIALVFSKIIDPQNPLYLDDSFREETIDWEFGLKTKSKGSVTEMALPADDKANKRDTSMIVSGKEIHETNDGGIGNTKEARKKKQPVFELIDPDEVVDPATLNNEPSSDEDDTASEDSETSSDSSLQPYDLNDDDTDLRRNFSQLVDVVGALRKSDDAEGVERALEVVEKLVRASPDELKYIAGDLVRTLIQVRCSDLTVEGEEDSAEEKRQKALVALAVTCPTESLESLNKLLYSPNLDISQRIIILDVMTVAAEELASSRIPKIENRRKVLIDSASDQPWFKPRNSISSGAGSWKEISSTETPLNWFYSYERELPSKRGQIRKGKTRRWSLQSTVAGNQMEWSQNRFPQYAAAFMLPAMQGFDKKRHGVDLLGRDTIVLGKLIYMLGICIKCAAMHPEAFVVAGPLLDMLRSREISHHAEAYVRRSVLFAASCVLLALHPSFVASAVVQGNTEISTGLDWVRTWALQVAESDTDRECYTMAMTCLKLHAEMALQASRAIESSDSSMKANGINLLPNVTEGSIKIPHSNFGT